ncbi:hypothetical protein PRIPAC_78523 [Pristionchus pacificus]|uniref:DUF148 domain-containing protein n=1 Tax=Pristionchus pacificus TaxID=54126 RepID=A0A454XLT9_PRIPA|nr:hypothetical protein PRIPAC_78523 [Pristionchus pacificus]|eukprot:PDM79690.1 hypothetical protein PRIPAC_32269 [Pristionchus pacificus]
MGSRFHRLPAYSVFNMRYVILLFASLSVVLAKKDQSYGSNSNELYGRKGHGGRGGHGGPPFLANVTQEGRTAYFKLIEIKNQTKGEIKSAVDAWANTYNVSAAVTAFESEMETLKTERRANVTTAVGELAEAIYALNAIQDDQNISNAETSAQIREAIQAMSPELRDLVLAAMPQGGEGGKGGKKEKGWKGGMGAMGGNGRFGNGFGHGGF